MPLGNCLMPFQGVLLLPISSYSRYAIIYSLILKFLINKTTSNRINKKTTSFVRWLFLIE